MEIKYDYSCGKQEAYTKVDGLLTKLESEHSDKISGASREWNEANDYMTFKFKAMSFGVEGNVQLKENNLILYGKLPFAARMFQGKIKATIKSTLDDLF